MARKVEQGLIQNAGLSLTDDRLWRLDVAPKNVYVAATILNQVEALRLALELQDAGFHVTSKWLRHKHAGRPTKDDWAAHVADREWYGKLDRDDLEKSDTLIILADQPSATGGYHVELGYFLGANRSNIIVVGDRPNVFYWLEDVRYALSTEGLVEWLKDPSHGQGQPTLPPVFDKFEYDDGVVHAGSDAFACSMRANWLKAERQLKLLRAKNEVLLSYDKFVDDFWFIVDSDLGGMDEPAYLGLCIAGEAGEVAEKLKKAYRDHGGKVDPDSMLKELGDVLHYLTRYAHLLGNDLEDVARKNVEKLRDRAARDKLRGEGDER